MFQTGASRAQIRNRCVGGEARGNGGRDGGDGKVEGERPERRQDREQGTLPREGKRREKPKGLGAREKRGKRGI